MPHPIVKKGELKYWNHAKRMAIAALKSQKKIRGKVDQITSKKADDMITRGKGWGLVMSFFKKLRSGKLQMKHANFIITAAPSFFDLAYLRAGLEDRGFKEVKFSNILSDISSATSSDGLFNYSKKLTDSLEMTAFVVSETQAVHILVKPTNLSGCFVSQPEKSGGISYDKALAKIDAISKETKELARITAECLEISKAMKEINAGMPEGFQAYTHISRM